MGWPAHNPELYDEICMKAILRKLVSRSNIGLMNYQEDYVEEKLLEALECYPINMALCEWASKEISEEEVDHFVP